MEISGIHHISQAQGISGPHFAEKTSRGATESTASTTPQTDEIEISTTAEKLSAAEKLSGSESAGEIRYDLVNRIRGEIAAGTYDTPERMDIAMERFLSRIG